MSVHEPVGTGTSSAEGDEASHLLVRVASGEFGMASSQTSSEEEDTEVAGKNTLRLVFPIVLLGTHISR